jgi:hypothetical protein
LILLGLSTGMRACAAFGQALPTGEMSFNTLVRKVGLGKECLLDHFEQRSGHHT